MQRKLEYLEDWKEKQTQASEEMVKELFLKLLPGAEAHVSNYYPVRNSLKQTNENDIMLLHPETKKSLLCGFHWSTMTKTN